jgi:hypothetical protein
MGHLDISLVGDKISLFFSVDFNVGCGRNQKTIDPGYLEVWESPSSQYLQQIFLG